MASPLAEAFVRVRADTRAVAADLDRGLVSPIAKATRKGNVRVRADTKGVAADLDRGLVSPIAKATDKVGKTAGKTAGKFGREFKSALAGAFTGVALFSAIKNVVGGIKSIGFAYEDALNTFRAVSGATAAEMAEVATAAKTLGNDLTLPGVSAGDAATAMTELAKAGLSVDEALAAGKGTLQLAAAGALDAGSAATIAANALNSFGLEGARATDVANVLANAANVSSGEVGDFGAALTQASAVARGAGLSIEETTGALALLANQGIRGSDAGTSLRTTLLRLQAPADVAADTMEQYGFAVRDANGVMLPFEQIVANLQTSFAGLSDAERDAAFVTIFGQDAIRTASVLYREGAGEVARYTTEVGKAGGAAAVAAAKSQGLAGATRALQSQFETIAVSIYQGASPALQNVVGAISAVVTELPKVAAVGADVVGFFRDNEGAATALGAVLGASLIPRLLAAGAAFRALALAQLVAARASVTAGLASLVTPAGLAVAAIGALTYAFVKNKIEQKKFNEQAHETAQALLAAANPKAARSYDELTTAQRNATIELTANRDAANAAADANGRRADSIDAVQKANERVKYDGGAVREGIRVAKESQAALDALSRSFTVTTANIEGVRNALGLTADEVVQLANKAGVDLSDGVNASASALVDFYTSSIKGAKGAGELAASTETMSSKVATAEEKVDALKAALDRLVGGALSAEQAESNVQAALDGVTASLKENGRSLDLGTEKGRANLAALRELASAGIEQIKVLADQGVGQDKLGPKFAKTIADFRATATAAGLTKDQVQALATKYGLVPSTVTTIIGETGAAATRAKIDAVTAAVNRLPSYHAINIDVRTNLSAVASKLDRLDGKAAGGRVIKDTPYIVGEHRPELFVPNQSGTILPRVPGANSSGTAIGSDPMLVKLLTSIDRKLDRLGGIGADVAGNLLGPVSANALQRRAAFGGG